MHGSAGCTISSLAPLPGQNPELTHRGSWNQPVDAQSDKVRGENMHRVHACGESGSMTHTRCPMSSLLSRHNPPWCRDRVPAPGRPGSYRCCLIGRGRRGRIHSPGDEICYRPRLPEVAAMSSMGLRAGVFFESCIEGPWDGRWERARM